MVDGRWKMEDCNLGSAMRVAHASRVLANPSRVRGLFEDRFGVTPKPTRETRAIPGRRRVSLQVQEQKEMPDRASLAIRHLVDVQLAAAKTELCVTVVFSEL